MMPNLEPLCGMTVQHIAQPYVTGSPWAAPANPTYRGLEPGRWLGQEWCPRSQTHKGDSLFPRIL